jgi:hypothetical protein
MKASHLAALIALLPLTGPAMAQTPPALWGVGATGIDCFMAPCPYWGIFPVDSKGRRSQPVMTADDPLPLPPLVAAPADARAIAAAWTSGGCLVVAGSFADGVLTVESIVGDC